MNVVIKAVVFPVLSKWTIRNIKTMRNVTIINVYLPQFVKIIVDFQGKFFKSFEQNPEKDESLFEIVRLSPKK